jgi:NhaA family Na+:H+ antiporter
MFMRTIKAFVQHEASGGIVLLATAIAALAISNSVWSDGYFGILDTPAVARIGLFSIEKPILLWINDGLMAVFFLLVGLEIKREVVEGELSSLPQIGLPGAAAIGGMAVPAAVFLLINLGSPENFRGWAIPAATDIAFALGVLALLGPRVPAALKVFLLALAIIDDLGAILVIALFYTADLSTESLALAGVAIAFLVVLNRARVARIAPYLLVGVVLWVFVLKSGVHATLAGVVVALAIPTRDAGGGSPLRTLEHALLPYVAFAIMPIFAFANAGVPLAGLNLAALLDPLTLGIAAGLLVGKPIGIVGAVWLATRLRIATMPDGITWAHILGVSFLAGIGFTMSLFIGGLAFDTTEAAAAVRLGVLGGSIAAAVIGFTMLRLVPAGRPTTALGRAGMEANAGT